MPSSTTAPQSSRQRRGDELRQRLNFWGTLALMRCVASSPAAAVQALRTRAGEELDAEAGRICSSRIFDGDGGCASRRRCRAAGGP